jgi:hypothetical protein
LVLYLVLYMPSIRTHINLPADLRLRAGERAHREGKSLSQIIREALDAYVADQAPDAALALDRTFGAAPDLKVPVRDFSRVPDLQVQPPR